PLLQQLMWWEQHASLPKGTVLAHVQPNDDTRIVLVPKSPDIFMHEVRAATAAPVPADVRQAIHEQTTRQPASIARHWANRLKSLLERAKELQPSELAALAETDAILQQVNSGKAGAVDERDLELHPVETLNQLALPIRTSLLGRFRSSNDDEVAARLSQVTLQEVEDGFPVIQGPKLRAIDDMSASMINDLILDDVPSRELPAQLGIAQLTQILTLQAAIAELLKDPDVALWPALW
ncbi:unnamed protein product, partial [Effrenium voratum]